MHQNIANIAIKCVFCYGQFYALQSNEIGIAIQKKVQYWHKNSVDLKHKDTHWLYQQQQISSDLKIL